MRFPILLTKAGVMLTLALPMGAVFSLPSFEPAYAQFMASPPTRGERRGGRDFEMFDPCAFGDCYRRRPPPRIIVIPEMRRPPVVYDDYYYDDYIEEAPRRRRPPPPPPRNRAKQPQQTPRAPASVTAGLISGRDYRPEEILVEFPLTVPQSEIDAIAQQQNIEQLGSQEISLLNVRLHRWRVTGGRSLNSVVTALRGNANVSAANLNRVFTLQESAVSGPPQYAAEKLGLQKAHALTLGEGIRVALIDSGADSDHPELAGVIAETYDALGGKYEAHEHGTSMAGAIAANAQVKGAAPKAQILNVRAFAPNGKTSDGTTFDIIRGMDWAAQKQARVFNLSFAGPKDPLLARVVKAANEKGIVVVAAAGNAGPKSPPLYPAADIGVIAVTATDAEDKVIDVANRGGYVTLAAPGADILLPAPNKAYTVSSGTSIATAYVSGVAALLLARNPEADAREVYEVLTGTARDLGAKGRDREYGAGLTNPVAALEAMEPLPQTVSIPAGPAAPR